jgi:hypothetical protein
LEVSNLVFAFALEIIPVRGILLFSSNSKTILTGSPVLKDFLVLIKRPVVEILEDIPVYSSVLQEKVTGNRFILRFASRLSAIIV